MRIKRHNPIDRLLHKYHMGQINADIYARYAHNLPPSKETVKMVGEIIHYKYPFYDNAEHEQMDMIEKYNRSLKIAMQLQQKAKEDNGS